MAEKIPPEREWKRIHREKLWMIEDLNQEFAADILFNRLPTFSLAKWIWWLCGSALCLIAASYLLDGHQNWLSNLCLNLAMGVVASVMILIYTTRREHVVAGYQGVIENLESRIAVLSAVQSKDLVDPQFAFQSQSYEDGCGWLWAHYNFSPVVKGYFDYLAKHLSDRFKSFEWQKARLQMEKMSRQEDDVVRPFLDDWLRTKAENDEMKRECCYVLWDNNRCRLQILDALLAKVKAEVTTVRVGGPSREEDERKDAGGGAGEENGNGD